MPHKANYPTIDALASKIRAARGKTPVDLVIKNARYLDVYAGKFRSGDVAIHQGTIVGVADAYEGQKTIDAEGSYVVPGFIDSHVHIESSLMTPAQFERAVLPCGTTTVIWDPHEIANVKGAAGIAWALAESEGLSLDVFVMVPSCVPSTSPALGLESSGAVLGPNDLAPFRAHPRVIGLAEMMNYPGLLSGDDEVLTKLDLFKTLRRDGHCPSLTGKDLNAYGVAGIHSCHESTTEAEADEKLGKGIHVLIREGSCAKDAAALLPLVTPFSSAVIGLCSDDRNPADIAEAGHVNAIIDQGLRRGIEPAAIFRAASFAAARLFGLDDRGAIAPGHQADLVLCRPHRADDWTSGLAIESVVKSGKIVSHDLLERQAAKHRAPSFGGKNLHLAPTAPGDFRVTSARGQETMDVRVIGVIPRQILTNALIQTLDARGGEIKSDLRSDTLKIAVLERHHGTGQRSVAFVRGFGLTRGAIATSINHDSHNVIVVGASDAAMSEAVNRLIALDGGIVVVDGQGHGEELSLEVAGLMTNRSPSDVAEALHRLKALTRSLGCPLEEPFLQLSFLALPVIPTLKITDRGLVDVTKFALCPVTL